MKKILATVALIAVTSGVAFAAAGDAPGTPGDKNCVGQTMVFLAQASKNGLADEGYRGIGGIARGAELSVKEVKAIVDAYCAAP